MFNKKRKEEQRRFEAKAQADRFYEHSVETIEKYGEALKKIIEVVNSDNIFESIKTFNLPFPDQASLKVIVGNVELEFNKAIESAGWQLLGKPSESILNDPRKKSIYLARLGMKIQEIGHFNSLNKGSEFLVKYLSALFVEHLRMVRAIKVRPSVNEIQFMLSYGYDYESHITEVLDKMLTQSDLNVLSKRIENLAIEKILEQKGF
jgi:hypothetical protein